MPEPARLGKKPSFSLIHQLEALARSFLLFYRPPFSIIRDYRFSSPILMSVRKAGISRLIMCEVRLRFICRDNGT